MSSQLSAGLGSGIGWCRPERIDETFAPKVVRTIDEDVPDGDGVGAGWRDGLGDGSRASPPAVHENVASHGGALVP